MLQLWARAFAVGVTGVAVTTFAGCSPDLDWREVRLPRGNVALTLPCRPSTYERALQLAGVEVAMGLLACRAGGLTWAVAHADIGDPALVTAALQALRAAAVANIDGRVESVHPLQRPGFTPNEAAAELAITGRLPDGQSASSRVAVFAVGTSVVQVSAVGASMPADWQVFIATVRVRPQ